MSVFEIRCGIDRLKPCKKRSLLEHWLTMEVMPRFAGRFVPVDEQIADVAGKMVGAKHREGHPAVSSDALIAATAKVLGLRMATLDKTDFERLGVELVQF